MVSSMRKLAAVYKSPRGRIIVNLVSAVLAVGLAILAGRHFAETGWPLANANYWLVGLSGACFLAAYAFKAFGWQRLFHPSERPVPMALAAAGGAASVTGAALPGRFDDVVRVAVVRKYPGCRSGVGSLCFSLFTLGLIDAAALMPLASTAAATTDASGFVRAAMGIVAFAGVGAAAVIAFMPRIVTSGRLVKYRLAGWISQRTTTPREAWTAGGYVLVSWIFRTLGLYFLLAALGFSFSFPLAVAFLCAGAASSALPIAPAGAATQAGAGAAILIASGVGTTQAIAFAVAAQALLIMAGAVVVIVAALRVGGQRAAAAVGGQRAAAAALRAA